MSAASLSLTEDQSASLYAHLFPGDGREAVAFLACGRARGPDRERLVVREVHPIPHGRCERTPVSVRWNAEDIEMLLYRAESEGLSLVKVHSHPGGYPQFSDTDDTSDAELLPTIRSWVEADVPHGSVIMLPDGRLFGRYLWRDAEMRDFDLVNVVGPTLRFWWARDEFDEDAAAHGEAQDQAFGVGTTRQMRRLRVGVVGVSGTGSPTIEQLMRLGAGHLVIVDDDVIEKRNLNRILFATKKHAEDLVLKVTAAKENIGRKNLGTIVTAIDKPVQSPEAIRALAQCDVIFGCVDTVGARFTMNLLASHYIVPYFDLGALLDAEPKAGGGSTIKDILGTVHYMVPGRSSLLTRDLFTLDDVRAEGLHKKDPTAAAQQVKQGYIRGARVSRPAVVSVNMFLSSLAVNDFLARLHPYRRMTNADVASIEFSLAELRITADEEMERCPAMGLFLGFGDRKPLLGLPEYSE